MAIQDPQGTASLPAASRIFVRLSSSTWTCPEKSSKTPQSGLPGSLEVRPTACPASAHRSTETIAMAHVEIRRLREAFALLTVSVLRSRFRLPALRTRPHGPRRPDSPTSPHANADDGRSVRAARTAPWYSSLRA